MRLMQHSSIALLVAAAACSGSPVQDRPIGTSATASAQVPLDKPYDELTPAQKSAVVSDYGKLRPGDEPPFPAAGLDPIVRQVRDLEQSRLAKGPAAMVVSVNARGEPTKVTVYRANAFPEMTQALAYVLMHTKYKPARCQGRPCEGEYLFSFDFSAR